MAFATFSYGYLTAFSSSGVMNSETANFSPLFYGSTSTLSADPSAVVPEMKLLKLLQCEGLKWLLGDHRTPHTRDKRAYEAYSEPSEVTQPRQKVFLSNS